MKVQGCFFLYAHEFISFFFKETLSLKLISILFYILKSE